jgi:hypothetical protein
MEVADKVRENKLRRYAHRLGVAIVKSRNSLWSVDNQLGYMILDNRGNFVVAGEKFDLSMDDVESFLKEYEATLH